MLFSFIFPLHSYAITLSEVITLALKNDYQLQNKHYLLESSKSTHKSQYSLFIPSVSAGYTYNYRAPQNRPSYSSNTLNITGQMNLFNGMQDFYTFKKSKTNIKMQENNLDSNRNDIVLNTKLTYIKILENKQALKIAQDSIRLLETQLNQATQFYMHGISDKSAALSVEVNLANAKIQLTQVQLDLNYNLDILQKLSGQLIVAESMEEVLVQESISYDKNQLLERIYQNNPQMQTLRLIMEQNNFDKKIAQAKYYPQLNFNASKYWYLTGANTSLINTGLQSQVRIDATWNLFDSYSAFFDSQSVKINALALNSQIIDLRKDIETEVQNLLNSLSVAKDQLNYAKLALTQAEENYRIVSNRYKQNIANYIELLNAELLLTNAKGSLVTARYGIATNVARIEYLENQQF
ncbi:TolC family protein [Helicobacter didelphidarum]|uniref:TolC family protein n=1 Tax=Helicobacter didelphidarum TaxID=2040648 RepID=UPI0015F14156|nr:TolC family protein [Helicobacter didelphidarum]